MPVVGGDWLLSTWMKQLPNGGSGQIVSNKCDESFTADHSRYGWLKNGDD